MSFLRHEEIYRSDVAKGWEATRSSASQHSSAAMSFQPAIPWRVALQQSPPPLRRLATILRQSERRTTLFHPTATTPLTSCLTIGVHFKERPPPPCSSRIMLVLRVIQAIGTR